jgi:hypothetical protein
LASDGQELRMRALPHASPYEVPRRRRRLSRIARSLAVLGLEAAAALALFTVVTGAQSAPAEPSEASPSISADEVATRPARFRAREVRVTGRIRPRPERVSKQDRLAFVLEGTRDGRLLVVPAEGTRLPGYRAGTAVIVRGTVVVPPDSKRLARRVASRTAVAQRADATAIVKAVEVEVAP